MTAMTDAEAARLRLLQALELLDTPAEAVFDRITRLLSKALDVPIALVTLVDAERQWFKSAVGLTIRETPREIAFCAHAIEGSGMLVVPDARQDPRFAENPLVCSAPNIRFYAGVPLRTRSGHALGTLCAIDDRPRQLDPQQREILEDLAALVTRELQAREAAIMSRTQIEQADLAIARTEARFQTVFECVGAGIAIVAPDGHWLRVNSAMARILGYTQQELSSLTFQDVTVPEDLAGDLALLERLVAGEIDRYELEKRYRRKDGETTWAHLTVTKHCDEHGRLDYFLAVVEQIDERKAAETELASLNQALEERVNTRTLDLRKREAELAAVLEYTKDAYVCTDEHGVITAWNRQAELTFGWQRQEAIGQFMHDLLVPEDMRAMHQLGMQRYLDTGEARVLNQRIELPALRKDGQTIPVEVHISALPVDGKVHFNAFLHEISERKRREEQRQREALQDALTGLPNRRAMLETLPVSVARAVESRQVLALLFVDLDGFKQVNDSFGHDAGDALLREVASRLRGGLRASDSVFRLAGDEFTVLLEQIGHPDNAVKVTQKLLASIDAPIFVQGHALAVQASIGLALLDPAAPCTAEQLIKQADHAMYEAKRAGRNGYRVAS